MTVEQRLIELRKQGHIVLSASAVTGLQSCPRKYYYRNIMKIADKKNKYLVGGSNAHNAAETFVDYYKTNKTQDVMMMSMVMEELLRTYWNVPRELGYDDKQKEKLFNVYKKKCIGWVQRWYDETKGDIIVCESHVLSERIMFHGFIDRIEYFKDKNEVWITDMKTSNKTDIKDGYKFQDLVYMIMHKDMHPNENYKYRLFLDFFEKGKVEVPFTEDDIKKAEEMILNARKFLDKAQKDISKFPRGFSYCDNCAYKDRCFIE